MYDTTKTLPMVIYSYPENQLLIKKCLTEHLMEGTLLTLFIKQGEHPILRDIHLNLKVVEVHGR